ncbi:MAG: glycosyltransferase [Chloroflexi bacterium]|nr:glycosyltransferase [Chloroflexota bacterium]
MNEAANIDVAIGVMAHNEEASIAALFAALGTQRTTTCHIAAITVVASGCTDGTVRRAQEFAARDPRVRVLVQPQREGKASAINLFLRETREPVVVLVGADTVPEANAIELLVRPFADPAVGMTGGRPVPMNDASSLVGYTVHLQWRLHDRIAARTPKLGEVIAFRNVLPRIDGETSVDELSIEATLVERGFRLAYVPEAIVYNRGPATIGEFLTQRRRIHAGHLQVAAQQGYRAATLGYRPLLSALVHEVEPHPVELARVAGAIALEALARSLGTYDFLRRRSHRVWSVLETTKRVLPHGHVARAQATVQSLYTIQIADYAVIVNHVGHRRAEALLQRIAVAIRHEVRAMDQVSSHPTEGLIVVVAPTTATGSAALHSRLLERVRQLPLAEVDLDAPGRVVCTALEMPLAGATALAV